MKGYWLLLAVFAAGCILLLQVGCQERAGQPPEPKPPTVSVVPEPVPEPTKKGPRIKFEKVAHNFGEVNPGSTHRYEFKFKNIGDEVLKLKQPSSSCLCTVAKLDKGEYAPGESGVVRVTKFRVPEKRGVKSQPLYISSNDKSTPKVKLVIKARVVLKVAYEPKKLKLLLKGEDADCPEIKLASLDGQAFAIKSFRATGGAITADYDPSLKATSHIIQPRVNTKRLQKRLRGSIDIRLTHPECNKVTIPFNVLPQFKLKPPSIIIYNAEPEKPVRKVVWVLHNYGQDFEVESVSSKKGIIEILSQEKTGNGYKFKLRITPPADVSKNRFADVFYIKIKDGAKLKVNCSGFY